MFDKDLFIAGFRQGWRTARLSEDAIVMIGAISAAITALLLVLNARGASDLW
ncbi:MAG: hypothetical protein ACK51K_09020 [Gammaproteobacteria bacterium]